MVVNHLTRQIRLVAFMLVTFLCADLARSFSPLQTRSTVRSSSQRLPLPPVAGSASVWSGHMTKQGRSSSAAAKSSNVVVLQSFKLPEGADPTGLRRGIVVLGIVGVICVWIFSIPVEFRRAKLCSELQVQENPESRCMTASGWASGIQDYYANGGGINFDFTVEKTD
mmetsp:Transcript_101/g.163  ORF Transcript_101/g.163 Transcript_101/m.163 type:complete len:168 (-) Transcript_101:198-701(-)|eukprot:CAMPEP_0198284822 /NCGR_PEP_ID=MMETSP1449-20131203/4233_1 /TAXON_ID=420275 /ORGANISM="Attheya septentrionalis, Strain CCMP2084" /LENGTH=167 /DNA_ID=CAMNT_0043982037 /DNA_START=52 /DNA_END=555 /DNA_ORIENTATION=-